MRLGLDFDNTLICYDGVFHHTALAQGLIPPELPPSKLAVRQHLRAGGQEQRWIELQGEVYGARVMAAEAYPGVRAFLCWARDAGIELTIISHKTRHALAGPAYDLHQAARAWLAHHLSQGQEPLIRPERVFFELTREDKLARIAHQRCDCFVDDLPEVLSAAGFPHATTPIHFAPDPDGPTPEGMLRVSSWGQLRGLIEAQVTGRSPGARYLNRPPHQP